jgi:carbon-monoxide dehydrogenase large subunit
MVQFGVGQPVRRTEDRRFVAGHGRYTDDVALPRQAHAAVLRSPHAHARILGIDTRAAAAAPGVLAVFTHADLERDGIGGVPCMVPMQNRDGSAAPMPPCPLLAGDRVRHVGDSVAFLVAETAAQARDALELIEVRYEPLPAIVDPAKAMEGGQPLVWDDVPRNRQLDWALGDEAAADAALARAAHKVSLTLVNNRVVPNSMETRGGLGLWDPGEERFTLYASTQGSHFLRQQLAENVFRMPENRFRVVTPDVGGGFGMKLFLYREHALVLYAARRLGRPVKWTGERSDAFMTDTHGRDNVTTATLGLDEDGRFLAVKVETIANFGAYLSNYAPYIPTYSGAPMLVGLYDIPAAHVAIKGVFTHTVPVDAYRGAGRPEAAYTVERLVDAAARRLGLDRAELRRRNYIPPGKMPYKTALDLIYDSGEFAQNLDAALEAIRADEFPARRAAAREAGRLRGLGGASYIEICGGGCDEAAELRFDPSGTATLLIGTQTSGQGHQTAYAQIVADRLGLPFEKIRVVQGDTDVVGFGRGTGGSRSLPVGGVAVDKAAAKVIEKGRRIAAHKLEAAEGDIEFADGAFRIAGTDRRIGIEEVARTAFNPLELPPGLEPGLAEKVHFLPTAATFPNGCQACEIEIDPDTGTVTVARYVVVDDFGNVVNPLLLAGQVHGGVAQGIGQALFEECVYDTESGQLVTGSLMDYCLPRAADVPPVEFSYKVVPCATNPLGIKGAGEAGAIGAPPAVMNAVVDALAEFGNEPGDIAATPQKMWRLLQERRPARAAE